MNRLDRIEQGMKKNKFPPFRVGDTVRVSVKVVEGEKERVQVFEGTVIARKGGGHRETVTIRKLSFGVGVERIFPLNAPSIDKIEVVMEGHVRRAKLYYLRTKSGKSAKIAEREYSTRAAGKSPAPESEFESEPAAEPVKVEKI